MIVKFGLAIVAALSFAPATLAQSAAAPRHSDKSYYLPMRDGVKVAVNLYFPGNLAPTTKVTTILVQTRYGRGNALRDPRIAAQLAAGRVVVAIDTRGSTASFGTRRNEIPEAERLDMDALANYLAAQPWSNGKIITMGTSYLAATADLAMTQPSPALVGAIPMQLDFDVYTLFYPGGVLNTGFINGWGAMTLRMDLGRALDDSGKDCRIRAQDCPALFPILQPVDDDKDFAQLREALNAKQRWLTQDWQGVSFRDDPGASTGLSLFSSSSGAHVADFARQKKPAQVWGSWMDAGTADNALMRFRSLPELPMEIWLTANNHANAMGNDSLRPGDRAPRPAPGEMVAIQTRFIEKLENRQPVGRHIHYYVMGAGEFRETSSWPPAGIIATKRFFGADGSLARIAGPEGVDRKDIDLTLSSGPKSRWTTQSAAIAADYPDRREVSAKMMTYDTEPMARAMELAGPTVVALEMASLSTDPALFVYLEDVAPGGRVTYLTEGQFRAIQRKPADPATLPYDAGPAPHSFLRADALPVSSGERIHVEFALNTVAARIERGHRLRIAIGGADTHMFQVYSNGGPERFDIFRGGRNGSSVTFPLKPWQ